MNLRHSVALRLQDVLTRIKEAEDYYKSLQPLMFLRKADKEEIKLKKSNNAETFVKKFFEKFNSEYVTVFKESKRVDTDVNTRRSIGDIFRIAYSYLGDKITLEDIIIEVTKAVENKQCASNYCYQINKTVYKERGNTNGTYYNPEISNELGLTRAHYHLLYK